MGQYEGLVTEGFTVTFNFDHHHIILYAVAIALALGGVYLIESRIAAHAEDKAEAAQIALAVEKDRSAQLEKVYQANQIERDKENAVFLQTIAQLQLNVKTQIIHDKALPPVELGKRIESVEGFKEGTISVDITGNLVVPVPVAQQIVGDLDQGKADAQTVVAQSGVIENLNKTVLDANGIIAEDKRVLASQIETDKKELSLVKAKARKSKLRWFGAGVVVGFIGRKLVGI